MNAVALVAVTSVLLGAGCSSSSEPGSAPPSEPPSTSTPALSTPPSSSAPNPKPKHLARGTLKVTSHRSLPPQEALGGYTAIRIADANYPAGLAAAPDGRIFFSELWGGKIRVIRRDGTVDPKPWANVNAIYGIKWTQFYHGGLTGIAFDPAFRRNHFVYVVTQVPSKTTGFANRSLILRFTEVNGRGRSPRILMTLPASKFDNTYSLIFGPDGMLYIPTGFLGERRPTHADPLTDLRGKILRVTPLGKAPENNPYGARAPRVWATGLKNTFDLAFFPHRDYAIGGDNGTVGHDEINLLMAGNDYGYPSHQGITRIRRLTSPMLDDVSDPPAPVGIIYYRGRRYPKLRGRFLMCNNHGPGLVALRIDRSDPGRLRALTPLVPECTLDIVETPNGSIVFSAAGAIYRLAPA